MKSSKRTGAVLGTLSLAILGCDPPAPPPETAAAPKKVESHEPPKVLYTPVPPIEPSMLPEMPTPDPGDAFRKDAPRPAEKKAEEPAKTDAPR